MSFLNFVVLIVIAYFAWRIVDLLPDIVFRLSELQRDVAEIRRAGEGSSPDAPDAPDAPGVGKDDPGEAEG